jgi:hypothetical protein
MKSKVLPVAMTVLWIITFGIALHNWTLGICLGLCMAWPLAFLAQTAVMKRVTSSTRCVTMKLKHLGICGIISLLSYTAMVVFSPLAYPGYDWLTMAVSDLSAVGAPSAELAERLNALFGPCGIVCAMAACVAVGGCRSRLLKAGVYFYAAMEWITVVGYKLFPWVEGAAASTFQNTMHLLVTAWWCSSPSSRWC